MARGSLDEIVDGAHHDDRITGAGEADLGTVEGQATTAERIGSGVAPVDLVVNNAGFGGAIGPVETLSVDEFDITFRIDEDGAVTVDWVVLTAAIVGLGIATLGVVSNGVDDLSGDIEGTLTGQRIVTTFN